MSTRDIPTLTICFEIESKFSVQVSLKLNATTISQLSEGKNKITNGKGVTYHLMLQNLEVGKTKTVGRRKCIKVSPMANELNIDLITFLEGYFFFVEFFVDLPFELLKSDRN